MRNTLRLSQLFTLGLGVLAMALAASMENVLALMLHSYAFMVSGLLVPLVGALFFGMRDARAALLAMVVGGGTTVGLTVLNVALPFGLDANIFGISAATMVALLFTRLAPSAPPRPIA
jgi:SSS family solute:Na+ symporter